MKPTDTPTPEPPPTQLNLKLPGAVNLDILEKEKNCPHCDRGANNGSMGWNSTSKLFVCCACGHIDDQLTDEARTTYAHLHKDQPELL